MELVSDVADFKDTQDVDDPPPHQESLPIAKQEAHFMTKDLAKEFTVIDQLKIMRWFSTLGKTIFQLS